MEIKFNLNKFSQLVIIRSDKFCSYKKWKRKNDAFLYKQNIDYNFIFV